MIGRVLAVLLIAVLAGGVLGCGNSGDHSEAKDHAKAAMDHGTKEVSAKLAAHLAKADAVDGKHDNVVAKCSGCALKMDGSPDHAMKVADYQLQFCSAGCKDHFAEGGEEAILALEIPALTGHEGHNH